MRICVDNANLNWWLYTSSARQHTFVFVLFHVRVPLCDVSQACNTRRLTFWWL